MADFVRNSRRLAIIVVAGAALFTLGIMIHVARPEETDSSLGWSVLAFSA